jgi:hypothetical protein
MQLQQNQSDPTQPRLPKLKLKIAGPNNSNESLNKSGEMTMKRPEQRSPNSSPSAVSLEGKNVVKPIKISLVNKNNAPNQKPPNVLMRNPSQESNIAFSLGKQQQQQQARGGGEQNMTTKDQYDLKDAGMLTNLLLSHQFGQEQQQQQTLKKTHEPTHEEEIELGEIVRPKKTPGQSQQQQQQHQKQQQQQQNQQLLKKIPSSNKLDQISNVQSKQSNNNRPDQMSNIQRQNIKKPQLSNQSPQQQQQQQQHQTLTPQQRQQQQLMKMQQQTNMRQQQQQQYQQQNQSSSGNLSDQVPKLYLFLFVFKDMIPDYLIMLI